ncbi:MAG: sensor histidine kinase [Thermodesulfobacteriota bacterium]
MLHAFDETTGKHTASGYPTKLVWMLSFLALYTTFIMVTIVWWTLLDVRSERERLDKEKSDFATSRTLLDSRLEKEKWDIAAILSGSPPPGAEPRSERFDQIVEQYLAHADIASLAAIAGELREKTAALARLRARSLLWNGEHGRTLAAIPPLDEKIRTILRRMDEAANLAANRDKEELAAKIARFHDSASGHALSLAREIITDMNSTEDVATLRRAIGELASLHERMMSETREEGLLQLKDNRMGPVLARLKTTIAASDDDGEPDSLAALLGGLEQLLFGEDFRIDAREPVMFAGGRESLYALCILRSRQLGQRELLRTEQTALAGDLHELAGAISQAMENELRGRAATAESAIKRALQIILIVGIATAAIFLAISYKIIHEIRIQIKAIEKTNEILDAKTRALTESQTALQKSEEQLQFLSSNLLCAQEKERQRIAYELHDELGQSMAALKLQVGAIERHLPDTPPEKLKIECASIRSHINEIIENMRRLSKDLSPVVIDDLGLEAAIEYLATNFAKLHNIPITLDIIDINPLFSQESQRLIYRIIQESLANISKHADAKQIFIASQWKPGEEAMTFIIQDDGRGFDVDSVLAKKSTEKGMGLATMAERVRILGGTLQIKSSPAHGTTVLFTAPILKSPPSDGPPEFRAVSI